ncbi:hypothetical protein BE04_22515 [Sorangium cellulosum]|uniref:Copper type II ascorbate-dependent monooxygenase C-terminal domain-containing protein n=2 Tax=Sorangium cellulosum TaxID=56 RepID=A0A150P9A4_SORCE|nr:hypothetical protein [Sorangium cellulosum]AGP36537.1 hypothetical protein SCE1572_19780 [Sorangium cellulosum So0157-2]KYF52210.1 hypothetical protein BE04_22515 [Sorangium cellulosum]
MTWCKTVRRARGAAALVLGVMGVTGCGDDEQAPSPSGSKVTWYRDIQPLVERSCASCHDGAGVGRVALTDAATAQRLAELMALRVSDGAMPPPVLDPSCRSYAGAERMSLTVDERARFEAWARDGAPLGDPADAPPPQRAKDTIDAPDATLEMPEAHDVTLDDDGNEYFCAIIDNPFTEPAWITAFEAMVGDPAVVHHMAVYRDLAGDAGVGYGVPPGTRAFPCRDPVIELDWQLLHSWAPGVGVTRLPEGAGVRVEPGEQLVLQMHYFGRRGTSSRDRSGYRLQLSREQPRAEVYMDVFGPVPFTIPAGAAGHSERSSTQNEGPPRLVYGLLPHMHLLGRSYRAWVERDGGEEECAARGEFEFHHQALYMFDEPLRWGTGDRFVAECTWDNTAESEGQFQLPPQDVPWGEGTNQEMCFMVAYLSDE